METETGRIHGQLRGLRELLWRDFRADLVIVVSILLIICAASWGLMRWQLNRVQHLLEEALARYGAPEIFNTDQGAQFTSEAFTDVLKAHGVAISMDGKGRWIDNVFIERLWRSVKYEDIYLRAYETPAALRAGLTRYFDFYNTRRRHTALDRRTPDAVYFEQVAVNTAA